MYKRQAKEWGKYCEFEIPKEPYILVYFLGEKSEHRRAVEKIQKLTNWKIISLPAAYLEMENNDYKKVWGGPKEFLSLIRGAALILSLIHILKEIAESMGCFEAISFVDNDREGAIGKWEEVETFYPEYNCAIAACDNGTKRLEWNKKLETLYNIPVLFHMDSTISPSANLMPGCIVEPRAVVGCGLSLIHIWTAAAQQLRLRSRK